MTNPSRIDAVVSVRPRTVRFVATLTVVSWLGMIVHDRISLPELSLWAPDVVFPTLVSVALFAAWWAWPGRLSLGLLIGWTVLHLVGGGLLSVLPWPFLPFLPFVPEETLQHYVAHAAYAACEVPLLVVLLRLRPGASNFTPAP